MTKPQEGALIALFMAVAAGSASAQVFEAVGSRALGMGGAFVAEASDSSATWWNPAAMADGPFVDIALGRAVTELQDSLPAWRDRASWFALTTPPFGVSYYRLQITDTRSVDSTDRAAANRQDTGAGVPVRSLSASQLGATLAHTLVSGVHVGTTLKYVRGTLRGSLENGFEEPSDLLERGEELDGGQAENHFDLDVGLLATAGPLRLGGVVRNILEPDFGGGAFTLPRQIRVGVAVHGEQAGWIPLTVAFDSDLQTYPTATGGRRVMAVGAEQWFRARRFGVRGGARFNRAGARERSVTGGVSVALRPGTFWDGYIVRGGSPEEQGWGLAARVSF